MIGRILKGVGSTLMVGIMMSGNVKCSEKKVESVLDLVVIENRVRSTSPNLADKVQAVKDLETEVFSIDGSPLSPRALELLNQVSELGEITNDTAVAELLQKDEIALLKTESERAKLMKQILEFGTHLKLAQQQEDVTKQALIIDADELHKQVIEALNGQSSERYKEKLKIALASRRGTIDTSVIAMRHDVQTSVTPVLIALYSVMLKKLTEICKDTGVEIDE